MQYAYITLDNKNKKDNTTDRKYNPLMTNKSRFLPVAGTDQSWAEWKKKKFCWFKPTYTNNEAVDFGIKNINQCIHLKLGRALNPNFTFLDTDYKSADSF